jgi:hypothetical protein
MSLNILTPEYKKKIYTDMRKRSVVVIIMAGMALIVCAGILFSGLYMFVQVEYSIAGSSLSLLVEQDENQEYRETTERIRSVNTRVREASTAFTMGALSDIISLLYNSTPSEIKIEEIRVKQKTKDAHGTLNVRGIATTREDLLFFVQTMKNNPAFSEVIVPVSHFVSGRDVTFSLSAEFIDVQNI